VRATILGGTAALVVADALRRRAGRWPTLPRLPVLPPRQRRWGIAVLLVAVGIVAPVLPPLAILTWWTRRRLDEQRALRAHTRAVRRALPEVVDLFALASTAGLSLPMAHPLVASCAPEPLRLALDDAHLATAAGRPRADALLEHLSPLGERAHALGNVLADHLRYGVPLVPALERTSLELRIDRRRAAELEARRVPVRLLGPLVTCVLPAFALLTVLPLLAASLDALPT
jgi:tight adherence protein C